MMGAYVVWDANGGTTSIWLLFEVYCTYDTKKKTTTMPVNPSHLRVWITHGMIVGGVMMLIHAQSSSVQYGSLMLVSLIYLYLRMLDHWQVQ